MFVQNQIKNLNNHKDIITAETRKADELLFVVAYVRESGVELILDQIKGKSARLLCSLDMGITQLSGIKKLLEHDVEVRVYKSNKGTFHPKIWLFGRADKQWKMLIGSANLTRAAFVDNVEASVLVEEQGVTQNALLFFHYLWDGENSSPVTLDEIDLLQDKIKKRRAFQPGPARTQKEEVSDRKKMDILLEYTKDWIDTPKFKKLESKGGSAMWRGWYIIPDHGYIIDRKIRDLKSYLPFIKDGVRESTEKYDRLLEKFVENSKFKKEQLLTSNRDLFVRQAKNYLIKLGWCCYPVKENGKPDKKTLLMTDLGMRIHQCADLAKVKKLYTDYFLGYSFNGLLIVRFTQKLLQELDYLTLEEFDYFVTHAYNDDDFSLIVNLVKTYRSLSNPADFRRLFKAYFEQVKEGTAKNVYGNYIKKVKHTVSVIGWCEGFARDEESFILKLTDGNRK